VSGRPRLTVLTYPVSWEMGDLVLRGKLALDEEGYLERWNGFLVPWFPRTEVDRYQEYVESLGEIEHQLAWIEWDGDVLVVHHENLDDGEPERIWDRNGLYPLGDGWTWQLVESAL
jgi:hypothetical protein